MVVIPIEPHWDRLQEYHQANIKDEEFWDWLRREYRAYQVYIKPTPKADGEKAACGLMFGDEEDSMMFLLRCK